MTNTPKVIEQKTNETHDAWQERCKRLVKIGETYTRHAHDHIYQRVRGGWKMIVRDNGSPVWGN